MNYLKGIFERMVSSSESNSDLNSHEEECDTPDRIEDEVVDMPINYVMYTHDGAIKKYAPNLRDVDFNKSTLLRKRL